MMKIPELLIPAGGPEQLRAAIACGADAVYLSGTAFNARMNATNFKDDEIERAIMLAHEYGVKVHVTLNTLIKTDEMSEALEYALKMYECGADALIVQDRGLASLIKRVMPEMSLHLSTQGTIYDAAGVVEAQSSGFSRVILSRELSGNEIQHIKKITGAEVEIFAHGAICISYSGQCHMSSFIGGRSGNRGACAQPCRLPYEMMLDDILLDSEMYPLSPSDMCLLPHLYEIAVAGVDSVKIEGRMKSPEYVALVTSVYRKYLNLVEELETQPEISAEDIKKLKQIFNRGNFTDAYFKGESGKNLMSESVPKHMGIDIGNLVSVDRKRGHARVKLTDRISNGDGIEIRYKGKTYGNIISYMKPVNGKSLVKEAYAGDTADIGDIPSLVSAEIETTGIRIYKTFDRQLVRDAELLYEKLPSGIEAEMFFYGEEGRNAVLSMNLKDDDYYFYAEAESTGALPLAERKSLDELAVKKQLMKTGGTPYYISDCSVNIVGTPFISVSELNTMRRTVIEQMTAQRCQKTRPPAAAVSAKRSQISSLLHNGSVCKKTDPVQNCTSAHTPAAGVTMAGAPIRDNAPAYTPAAGSKSICLYFYETGKININIDRYLSYFSNIDISDYEIWMYVPYLTADAEKMCRKIHESGIKTALYFPAITKGSFSEKMKEAAGHIMKMYKGGICNGVLLSQISQLALFDESDIFKISDESTNVYNKYTLMEFVERGVDRCVISHELSDVELDGFCNVEDRCEITLGGRIPLMFMEHCPVGSALTPGIGENSACSCGSRKYFCHKGEFALKDRKGEKYPLIPDSNTCRCTVLSYRGVQKSNRLKRLAEKGFSRFRFYVYDENPVLFFSGILDTSIE